MAREGGTHANIVGTVVYHDGNDLPSHHTCRVGLPGV